MEPPPQSRSRPRKRQRVTEAGNAANAVPNSAAGHNQGWGPAATHAPHGVSIAPVTNSSSHSQAVRAHSDTVHGQPPPTFPSQHLERSHQQVIAGPDGLMNGYSASPQHSHSQYSDQTSALNPPQPSDLSGLSSLGSLGDGSATNNTLHQHHSLSQHQHPTHPQQLAQQQHQQHQQFAQQHHISQQQQHQQHHHSQTLSQPQPNQQQHTQPQQLSQQPQVSQQPAQEQQAQQRSSGAGNNKTDRGVFQQYGVNTAGSDASPTAVSSSSTTFGNTVWPVTTSAPTAPASAPAPPAPAPMPLPSDAPGLAPPPEGIFRSFDDLMASVQKVAKDQGYGVVKLRASNYRDSKPTRYDLVCDRGGVKYNSTAKKRNPSTRKIDCPFRAKAVCEVNLGNQWRFAVQDGRHNHEPRIPAAVPGQENTPVAQGLRSATNKIDRLSHDTSTGIGRLEAQLEAIANTIYGRLNNIEKRLDAIENGRSAMMGGNGVPTMATPSMPPANMGGSLGNGPMTNGGLGANAMVDHQHRLSNMERVAGLDRGSLGGLDQRLGGMEQRGMELQMELPDISMPPMGQP